jgi:hypothetical protein
MLKYFVYAVRPELRMPPENVYYPITKNIKDYSKLITECGAAIPSTPGPRTPGVFRLKG